jgi:PHD/YefM family antitoxin component YafN of YafNO toxin-antitoxin module
MLKVSAAEFQRNFGHYHELALTQPVAVARNGREHTVLISMHEYHRLKRCEREAMGLPDFTAEDILALGAARAPDAAKAFDDEVT